MKLANSGIKGVAEFFHIHLLACRDEDAVVVELGHPCLLKLIKCDILLGGRSKVVGLFFCPCVVVYLIKHHHLRLVGTTEFL